MSTLSELYAVDAVAKDVKARILAYSGADGWQAFAEWVTRIHANPAITRDEARAAFIPWAEEIHNNTDFDGGVNSLIRFMGYADPLPPEAWDALKELLLSRTPERWADGVVPFTEESPIDERDPDRGYLIFRQTVRCVIDGRSATAVLDYDLAPHDVYGWVNTPKEWVVTYG